VIMQCIADLLIPVTEISFQSVSGVKMENMHFLSWHHMCVESTTDDRVETVPIDSNFQAQA